MRSAAPAAEDVPQERHLSFSPPNQPHQAAEMRVSIIPTTHLLAADIRRTAGTQTEAQLEQLLLAGATIAAQTGTGEHEIDLPEGLKRQGMSISISAVQSGEGRVAQITATVEQDSAIQTIRLQRRGDGWAIVEAARHLG